MKVEWRPEDIIAVTVAAAVLMAAGYDDMNEEDCVKAAARMRFKLNTITVEEILDESNITGHEQ